MNWNQLRGAVGVLLVTVIAANAACGGDDGEAGSSDRYAERSGLESTAVLDAICDSWETGSPDRPTVNQYVRDLLAPLELFNAGTPPDYTAEDIDSAVVAACDEHAGDPAGFLTAVRGDLGISEADLDVLVEKACARYRVQQTAMAERHGTDDDIATLIREIATSRGVTLMRLRKAIDGICPD